MASPVQPGHVEKTWNEKARRVLGWRARPTSDAILAVAESLVAKNLIKK